MNQVLREGGGRAGNQGGGEQDPPHPIVREAVGDQPANQPDRQGGNHRLGKAADQLGVAERRQIGQGQDGGDRDQQDAGGGAREGQARIEPNPHEPMVPHCSAGVEGAAMAVTGRFSAPPGA